MAPFTHRHGQADAHSEPESDRWSVPDLIDFDYYVDEDERLAHASVTERKRLEARDRRLYRDEIQERVGGASEHTARHRSRALRRWLTARRRAEDPELRPLLPGAAFASGQRLVTIGLGVVGALLGGGLASALLSYDGQHPINVSWYVFVLVIVQILLVAGTLAAWYSRRSRLVRGAAQDLSLIGHVIKPLFGRAARWVQRQRLAHVPPDVRDRAEAKRGLVQGHYSLYGPAAYLPMLIPAQVFGIGFNLGAIIVTISLEWFTDLAFGWGSALNVSPGTIHGLAQVIALPWSWLFGQGVGLPTLDQVAGTRIALKDPLFLYDAADLRSWRWFLVLSVFTYGLLPRLLLLGLSVLKQRRALAALPFTHQRTQALYARMVTPSVETGGASGIGPEMPIPAPLKPLTAPRTAPREEEEEPETPGEPIPEPAPEPEPVPEPEPEPAPAPEPKPAPAPKPEPEPEPKPVPEPKPKPVPEAKPVPEPKPEPEPKPVPKPKAAPEPKPAPEPEPKPKPEPKPAPKPEPKAAPKATPKPEPAPKAAARPAPKAVPQPKPAPAPKPEPAPKPKAEAKPEAEPAGPEIPADACVLLIHVDVADVLEEADHSRLQQLLRGCSGWRVAASATFGGGSAMAEVALGLIEHSRWEAPPARVALLQDGSQPPITEGLRFLRAVRAAAGEQAQVLLALVGDPEGDDPLPPVPEFDFTDWQRKIDQLGDPYLRLEMLAAPDEEDA